MGKPQYDVDSFRTLELSNLEKEKANEKQQEKESEMEFVRKKIKNIIEDQKLAEAETPGLKTAYSEGFTKLAEDTLEKSEKFSEFDYSKKGWFMRQMDEFSPKEVPKDYNFNADTNQLRALTNIAPPEASLENQMKLLIWNAEQQYKETQKVNNNTKPTYNPSNDSPDKK